MLAVVATIAFGLPTLLPVATGEKEINDAGRRLLAFVRERSSSSDYRDELGLISRVRGDSVYRMLQFPFRLNTV